MPDDNGEGQGLAMLRLEARRYKREMQQIWMQRELHEQKKSTTSFSTEDSSRNHDVRWRFSDTYTTSPATSGTPMLWNRREDVAVSHLEQLAIMQEGTQTDVPSKSEVQTETEELQHDDDVILSMRERRAVLSAANDIPILKTCSRHCDELRSRISQEAACEYLADAAIRVNADVVFTAKPKRVAVAGQVENPDYRYSRAFQPDENGKFSQNHTVATSPTGSFSNCQKNTVPIQYSRTGLRGLVCPVPQRDSACSPIHNLHEYEDRFRSFPDTFKGTTPTEMFSWQHDRPEAERASRIAPPSFSAQVSTPQLEISCAGGTKAGDNMSDFSNELSGSKRIRNEFTREGAMAARLAARIKHALEAIGGNADTRSTNSTSSLPGRVIQNISASSLCHIDEYPELKLPEVPGTTCGGRTLDNKDTVSSDGSLPRTRHRSKKIPVSSLQNQTNSTTPSDADTYFQNIMAALSTDRHTLNKLSGSCAAGEVSPARALRRAECRAEAARRENVKSCGDHPASHQASHQTDGMKCPVKNDVHQSVSKHVREKQKLLSNAQKLQNVAETAKRLYTDLVNCAFDELRASSDCGNLVKREDKDGAGNISNFARPLSEFCPSTETTSVNRAGGATTGKDEVCGKCHMCQPQSVSRSNSRACMENTPPSTCKDSWPCGLEHPPGPQTESLDEITIELSDSSPTNIKVAQNLCTERPGYNVEISTPYESPCQRECSPKNRGDNIIRRGTASWKDSCKPAMRRTGLSRECSPKTRSNVQMKKGSNQCLLDPCCVGPRDSCHMPAYAKCSRASTVTFSLPKKDPNKYLQDSCHVAPRNSCQTPTRAECSEAPTIRISHPKKDPDACLLDPYCIGSRNSCHMPTYAKSSRAPCGPGGNSRPKRNNGTNLDIKDPSGLSRCLVHHVKDIESLKGDLENISCCGKFRSAGKVRSKNVHDECPGHCLLNKERKQKSPGRPCRDISKFPQGRSDEISKVGTRSEARNHNDLCGIHDDVRGFSMKGKENETVNGGHEETSRLHHYSGEKLDFNDLVKNAHRSSQESSRSRGSERNHSTLTATEVFGKEHTFVGKETRQPPVIHMTGDDSVLSEVYTETTQLHKPQLDHVVRAAAAGLAKEIEVMIAEQLGKSNRKIRGSNYLNCRHKPPEDQNDSYRTTKLDSAVIAAANAVNKLKPVSLLPFMKQDEGNLKVTPRKGPTPRTRVKAEDAVGGSFYYQMNQELKELASKRMKLLRQERTQFQSHWLLFPRQEHGKHAEFSVKGRSLSDLRNLVNDESELQESGRFVKMRRSEEFSGFLDGPVGSHTACSKRQRSITSPAKEHGKKLLRLSVGKAESQAGRKKQDQHPTLSASLNKAVRNSKKGLDRPRTVSFDPLRSKFSSRKRRSVPEVDVEQLSSSASAQFEVAPFNRMSSSSFGRWKLPPEQAQAKPTTKRRILTKRKIRPPAWVDRMTKAKNVFTSLLRPALLAHSRKEPQQKATIRRRNFPPTGLMFRPSITSKHFGKHIPGGTAFTQVQRNSSRIRRKGPVPSIQYDIRTGRKIIYSEPEPGELLYTRVENRHVLANFKSHASCTRTSAAANSRGNYLRIKGWNADPLIRSDIPHKPADIIRYNRNGGLDVQVCSRDAGGKQKTLTAKSVRQMNTRHVSFAGMVVHNSSNEKNRKGLTDPRNVDSLHSHVAKKAISSRPRKVKRALEWRRNSLATKVPPTDKVHRYGCGGGQWTYHEGFWTEKFKPELEKVSQNESLESPMSSGSMSQLGTPILETRVAQDIENDSLSKPVNRAGVENMLTIDSSVFKSMNGEDVTDIAGENIARGKDSKSYATNFDIRNASDIQRSGVCGPDGKSQNPDLVKSLGFLRSDGLEGDVIIEHISVGAESCSEMELTIMAQSQAEVSKINCLNHQDARERRDRELPPKEFPWSPLSLLDGVFPDSTESEALANMFDRLQESTYVQNEAQSEERGPASDCFIRKQFLDSLDHENEGQLKKMELERTLMDIVLQTILEDDPLQDKEVSATRIEPISLPIYNRRVAMRADKEVEAIARSHDMSQSPISQAVSYIDRSTEHDIVPHVDRATEFDILPQVDRATELEISSLFSQDQNSQTTDVELLIQNIQRLTPSTHQNCFAKGSSAQVHHQAVECGVLRNTVGVQTADNTATISPASPSHPAIMPMLMPIFSQHLGTTTLPTILPTIHFELPIHITSSNVYPSPVTAATCSFPAGVNKETQASVSYIQLNPRETLGQVHHQVSNLSINSRAADGKLGAWEEGSEDESDWEELKRGASPSTPSTPFSSPDHQTSLRKVMELYTDNSYSIRPTVLAVQDPQPSTSEVFQVSAGNGLHADQHLVCELGPPIQMVTEIITEDITAEELSRTTSADVARRGISWAKVREIEKASIALLRAASKTTPPATSSSEFSRESSPEFHAWMSPGEANIEEVARSSTSGRFLNNVYNTRNFQEHLGMQTQTHAWTSLGSGRASFGEICNPVCFLGSLSEGEVEAGVVPSLDELGEIKNGYNPVLQSKTELVAQRTEPGEFH